MTYDRLVGIVEEKQTKLVQVVIWLDIVVLFVSTRIGSSIIKHVELTQHELPNRHLKNLRQLNNSQQRLAPLPMQVPTVHRDLHQQINLPQLPPLSPSPMELLLLRPSDGIN